MRLGLLLLTIIAIVAGTVYSTDVLENITTNPLGNHMEPKTIADDETNIREIGMIDNTTQPEWGTFNFGSLEDLKTMGTDVNGVSNLTVGEASTITDMSGNSTAESKVAPLPSGLTIHALPGVQPNGKLLNSFSFNNTGNNSVVAPRNYYLSQARVFAKATDKGVISKAAVTQDSIDVSKSSDVQSTIAVLQIPYGLDHLVADSTGVATNLDDTQKAANTIVKTLDELGKLHTSKASASQLSALLFKSGNLSPEFNNVNNLLNTGRYSDSYKQGLSIALGENKEGSKSLPPVLIQSDIPNNDVYGQFDFIYKSMISRSADGIYSPALVDWAQKNATSILAVLMVNQKLQAQFKGEAGGYATPMYMSKWNESKLPFYNDMKAKGKKSKEPFYLYTVVDPRVVTSTGSVTTTPVIPSKYIKPDLAYIFALYNSIMTQVWIGAEGINTSGSISQTWQDILSDMNSTIGKNKVDKKSFDLPRDANKISTTYSEYSNNNLVSGLSTAKGAKDKTAEVYPNKELIGSLRTLLPNGDIGTNTHITLNNKSYKITSIGTTKYSKRNEVSYLYRAFSSSGGDSYQRWKALLNAAMDTPIQPAIFSSHWGSSPSAAYIMMPVMLGGTEFPRAINIMMEDLLKPVGSDSAMKTMSYANRYIMAFNIKTDDTSKTTNTTGVVEVEAGKAIGTALNKNKPIVITGYNGGQNFSLVDYFKVQDALEATMDSPPIKAKSTDGKEVQLKYLNLFKDFFTIPEDKALVGSGNGEVAYVTGFDPQTMITSYASNASKSAVSQISPDYNTFFSHLKESSEQR